MPGILFAFVAALGFGATPVFVRLGLLHLRPSSGVIISLFTGFIAMLLLALAFDHQYVFALGAIAFVWFASAGFIYFVTGRFLSFTSVKLSGAAKASAILASQPLFATLFATTITGERLTVPIILGTLSITLGIALIARER